MNAQRQFALDLNGGFDAVAYWSTRVHKKWVVEIRASSGTQRLLQTLYVSARTRAGAELTGAANTTVKRKAVAVARLATPRDLGVISSS